MPPGASCFVVRHPITWETERRYENSSVTFVIALSTNLVFAHHNRTNEFGQKHGHRINCPNPKRNV